MPKILTQKYFLHHTRPVPHLGTTEKAHLGAGMTRLAEEEHLYTLQELKDFEFCD